MKKILVFLILFSCAKREYIKGEVKKYYIQKKKKVKSYEPFLRILLYENENPLYISGTGIYYAVDSQGKRYKFFADNILKIEKKSEEPLLYLDGKKTNLSLPLVFYTDENYFLKIQGKRYRGKIEIDEYLRVINLVKVEDYLRSVVPLEIGSPFLSNFEALKAQAVCARSYAMRKYLEKKESFFHLYADIKDQVYGGKDKENEITDLAIQMTRGEVLMYENEVALTLFHSTCGGTTSYYDEAFPNESFIPYLKSVRCNFQGKDLCSNSPYYRWKKEFSISDFMENLAGNISNLLGISLSGRDIIDFSISDRSSTGRVREVKVKTKKGTFTFKGYDIRKLLKKDGFLPSNFFFLKNQGNRVIIIGRGFGHGVGLCQYGALSLAKKGVGYDRILKFYYQGTKIQKIY
ncbi:MAG: SpoIID/LytB domain-containing protein [candidate division WOR-3 bacterium]